VTPLFALDPVVGVTLHFSFADAASLMPVLGFPLLALGLAGIGAFLIQREQRLHPDSLRDALVRGAREVRRRQIELRPLSSENKNGYLVRWNEIGKRFRQSPPQAIDDAGALLDQVFRDLGYPAGDHEIREEDLAGESRQAALHFRTAVAIANKAKRGTATIAELYAAFEAYRRLLFGLLQSAHPA
jgi:hypothetical protein